MFFFGVFGMQGKEKEIRDMSSITCKSCGRYSAYKLVKAYNYFHVFFIPVYNWGAKYYLVSRCCNDVFQIPNELGKALEEGQNIPIRDEDLTSVYNEAYYSGEKVCPNCRRSISSEFQYCPHCGNRT
ncbi:zinc ribbon domain-containing protein [Clostridium swellfunianum]|uniref:zinc ribbon domain-containing protein n=1 Tax=Clostridium swellfunianum TaxID=1367462 RepID=UPI00202E885C|nr:zinc ribbon domain-containing protein [Clostridium swellfunianum]MCM0648284.1 zinc ribbon domain-containing protein [Clostridium swellfunianum]